MDLNNIVGFKAVDKNGNERQVTVDEMTELVSARICYRCIRNINICCLIDVRWKKMSMSDQLTQSETLSWIRTLDMFQETKI